MSDIWLRTQPTADGKTYVATLEASDDVSITLTPETALRYARTVLEAVGQAEYDAAVLKQLHKTLELPLETAGEMLKSLREDRPPLNNDEFPLTFTPGVSLFDGHPFLLVNLSGKTIGQWEMPAAKEHALAVLEVSVGVDLDAAYYRKLISLYEIDPDRARAVVADIGAHR